MFRLVERRANFQSAPSSRAIPNRSYGFTLVELLVVITIIGILVGLLLPAVQVAREAGRRSQCSNNFHQIGLGVLAHEETHRFYPSGGWGWYWDGDPDRGFGANQCGGWIYSILPYVDQAALHDLGLGGDTATKKAAVLKMVQTPLTIMNCPTRRRSVLLPCVPGKKICYNAGGVSNDSAGSIGLARTDYASCVGDCSFTEIYDGPTTAPARVTRPVHIATAADPNPKIDVFRDCKGVVFECSEVTQSQVKDGATNQIFAGEKLVAMEDYDVGSRGADNENMYVGFDNDISRTVINPPSQDRFAVQSGALTLFGSAHASSCNFVFCDGSVRPINYSVDPIVFKCLGNRADGQTVDANDIR